MKTGGGGFNTESENMVRSFLDYSPQPFALPCQCHLLRFLSVPVVGSDFWVLHKFPRICYVSGG